jgi:hypothetical protein
LLGNDGQSQALFATSGQWRNTGMLLQRMDA